MFDKKIKGFWNFLVIRKKNLGFQVDSLSLLKKDSESEKSSSVYVLVSLCLLAVLRDFSAREITKLLGNLK